MQFLHPDQIGANLHGADIRVKTGEDNASFAAFLQNAGQDGVEVGIHVEVGWQVSVP